MPPISVTRSRCLATRALRARRATRARRCPRARCTPRSSRRSMVSTPRWSTRMSYEFISTEQKGRVGVITLNRPKQLNALSPGLMKELGQALLALDADAGVGAILLTGNEIAMQCDIVIAADNARFGQPEINLGVMPGYGGTQRLPRFTSKAKAMDLCLTARMMDAEEAERAGL